MELISIVTTKAKSSFSQIKFGEEVIVNLLSDEMSIMKHLQFFGNKFFGLVDLVEEEDTSELAAECLTFMAVAVNYSWKIPLGYFLIKGLTATC